MFFLSVYVSTFILFVPSFPEGKQVALRVGVVSQQLSVQAAAKYRDGTVM